jgi:hypothetical protein
MRTFLLLILLSISIQSFSQNKNVQLERAGTVYPNPYSDETSAIIFPQKVTVLDSVDGFIKVEFINEESKQKEIGWVNANLFEPNNMENVMNTVDEIVAGTHNRDEPNNIDENKVTYKTAFINSLKITEIPAILFTLFIMAFLSSFKDKRYKNGSKDDYERGGRPYRKKIWLLILLGLVAAIPLSLIFYIFNINIEIF